VLTTTAALALAGCSGDGTDGGDDGDSADSGDGADRTTPEQTATATATATPTAEPTETATESTPTATESATRSPEGTSASGTGDDGGDGGDGEYTKEEIGEVEENGVDELVIVGWESTAQPDEDRFQITVTIRNEGDESTGLTPQDYNLKTPVYDESGSQIGTQLGYYINKTEVENGETAFVRTGASLDDPGAVASYGIVLNCEMSFGTYC